RKQVQGATSAEEVRELRRRVAAALDMLPGSIVLLLGQAQLENEDSLARLVDSQDGAAVAVTVVQLASALAGEYRASERTEGCSWGSFTRSLKIEACGEASFYEQDVADRGTDSTSTNKRGHCTVAGSFVTFVFSQERTSEDNDATSESSLQAWSTTYATARFLINADGNLQELRRGSDTEIEIYTIGYGEGSFPSLLMKQK
ncbi:unnamed protein product, partial [Polarella glacialis]